MSTWERVKEALRRDWNQTKKDLMIGGRDLQQTVGDTIKQATGAEPVPPPGMASMHWDEIEPAVRFGYAARHHYDHEAWDPELESRLRSEWDEVNGEPTFDRYRPAVKYGWGYRTKAKSLP